MTDVAKLRQALKEITWVNVFSDNETWSGTEGYVAPATREMISICEEAEHHIKHAPLTLIDLNQLIDWAIDHGFFDDKFPRWVTEGSLFDEESEEWVELREEKEEKCQQ